MNKNLFLKLGKQKELKLFLLPVFFFLVVLTSLGGVIAQPPFQQDIATTGLDIAGIDFTSIKISTARTAVACVFNDSNGVPISTGISCQFRVYEVANTGSLKFTNTTPTINGNCFNFGIPATVYTMEGEYTRIIMCNSSVAGGFYKSTFDVTSDGLSHELNNIDNRTKFAFIVFFFLLAGTLVLFGIIKEDSNMSMLGTIMLFILSLYTLINGYGIYKDTYTNMFSLVMVGVSVYIAAKCMEDFLSNLNRL